MYPMMSVVLGLVLGNSYAAVDAELEVAGVEVDELVRTADALDHRIAPGRSFLNNNDAIGEFEESLYETMIGEHRKAAEGFFALVATGALQDAELHRDAEWYLAEALMGMGNFSTAERRFVDVADTREHPFRDDAILQLLELYSRSGNTEAFMDRYTRHILSGEIVATPAITYTIGRSFYRQDMLDKAVAEFSKLVPTDADYSRARYFLGVIELRRDSVASAAPLFQAAADTPYTTSVQREVHDLAKLAIARLAYERGDFVTAGENYQTVAGDSKHLPDVLYEQVWSNVKQNRYDEALRAVDLFLLASPDHHYAGTLRVMKGHLFMGCGQQPDRCPEPDLDAFEGDSYEMALSVYERVVEDYTPIRDRFGSLSKSQDEPEVYFQQVIAAGASDETGLPPFAVDLMRRDEELERAMDVYQTLEQQRRDLAESEQLIAEITALLEGPIAMGGYESSRYQALMNQSRTLRARLDLLSVERQWLVEQGANVSVVDGKMATLAALVDETVSKLEAARLEGKAPVSPEMTALEGDIAALKDTISGSKDRLAEVRAKLDAPRLRAADKAAVEAEAKGIEEALLASSTKLGEAEARLAGMLEAATPPTASAKLAPVDQAITDARKGFESMRPSQGRATSDRLDAMHQRLSYAQAKYANILDRLETLSSSEVGRVRTQFLSEVEAVGEQQSNLAQMAGEAEGLSTDLTRKGFARMEGFFADGILKAEMGIIDVYWTRKLEIADQRERIQDERNTLMAELERRFTLIRQKMEQ